MWRLKHPKKSKLVVSEAMFQLLLRPRYGQFSPRSVLWKKLFSCTYLDKYMRTRGSLSAENGATNRKHVSLKGLSLPHKPRRQNETLYKQSTKEECCWGINSGTITCLNISQAQNLKGDLQLMKHSFRAAGVCKIKAKSSDNSSFTELLISSVFEACI